MTTKSFKKTKKGREEIWEWEETPAVKDAIARYWQGVHSRRYWNNQAGEINDEG